jgi:hypothetical protein
MDDEDEYREFLKEEEEMRMKAENETLEVPDSVDIDSYADDALSKLSARPSPAEVEYDKNKPGGTEEEIAKLESMYARPSPTKVEGYEDTSGESIYEEPDDFDPFPVAERNRPSWLEKEAEAKGPRRRGKNTGAVDIERLREIEEQQRMADEYLERLNDGIIDIADVLDRPYFGSMDEPSYKQNYYGKSSYADRKEDLMGYTT